MSVYPHNGRLFHLCARINVRNTGPNVPSRTAGGGPRSSSTEPLAMLLTAIIEPSHSTDRIPAAARRYPAEVSCITSFGQNHSARRLRSLTRESVARCGAIGIAGASIQSIIRSMWCEGTLRAAHRGVLEERAGDAREKGTAQGQGQAHVRQGFTRRGGPLSNTSSLDSST